MIEVDLDMLTDLEQHVMGHLLKSESPMSLKQLISDLNVVSDPPVDEVALRGILTELELRKLAGSAMNRKTMMTGYFLPKSVKTAIQGKKNIQLTKTINIKQNNSVQTPNTKDRTGDAVKSTIDYLKSKFADLVKKVKTVSDPRSYTSIGGMEPCMLGYPEESLYSTADALHYLINLLLFHIDSWIGDAPSYREIILQSLSLLFEVCGTCLAKKHEILEDMISQNQSEILGQINASPDYKSVNSAVQTLETRMGQFSDTIKGEFPGIENHLCSIPLIASRLGGLGEEFSSRLSLTSELSDLERKNIVSLFDLLGSRSVGMIATKLSLSTVQPKNRQSLCRLHADIIFEGIPVTALVDTGSPYTLFDESILEEKKWDENAFGSSVTVSDFHRPFTLAGKLVTIEFPALGKTVTITAYLYRPLESLFRKKVLVGMDAISGIYPDIFRYARMHPQSVRISEAGIIGYLQSDETKHNFNRDFQLSYEDFMSACSELADEDELIESKNDEGQTIYTVPSHSNRVDRDEKKW